MAQDQSYRPSTPGSTKAGRVWAALIIAVLSAAVAPLVWNVATKGLVSYFLGNDPTFDPRNPNYYNYPDGQFGYFSDFFFTSLFVVAFLIPILLIGAEAIWTVRHTRRLRIAVVTMTTLLVAVAASYGYLHAERSIDAMVLVEVVIPLLWAAATLSVVALLLLYYYQAALPKNHVT